MKNLLIATENFLPRWDGVARFLSEVIPKLKEDYKITVIAPDFQGEFKEPEGVKVIRIPLFSFYVGDLNPARFKPGMIRKHCKEADIIWAQSIGPIGSLAILFGRLYNKTVISYYHSIEWELATKSTNISEVLKSVLNILTKWAARFLYNKCDLIMVPSREIAEILAWQKINAQKVIIPLGVDCKRFMPPADKGKAKQDIGIDPKNLVVGFVGRVGREKDLKTLYRGFSRAQATLKKDVVLMIVGSGVKELEELFVSKNYIKLAGSQDNVVPYFHAMDVYVLSSLTETSSLSTMEAMACAVPVLATPVGLTKQYIKEGYNGMFFPKGDHYTLGKKLRKMLRNRSLRISQGRNARATIIRLYSWDKTIRKIKKALSAY